MDMTQRVKEYVLSCGMSLVGIASIDRFENVPAGRKPEEILPGAKSVIVFGNYISDGVVQAKFRAKEDGNKAAEAIYGRYGHTMVPSIHLIGATYMICHFIERETGLPALPTMTGPWSLGRSFSHRHAAVAAGLGEFGWNKAVITPKYGERVRWGAIVTQLELTPDPLYSGEKLCSECGLCVSKCPTGAVPPISDENAETFECAGKTFRYGKINFNACRTACYALTKATGGDKDYLTAENPTDDDIEAAVQSKGFAPGDTLRPPTWRCDLCMDYCPSGDWKKKFKDRGLAK